MLLKDLKNKIYKYFALVSKNVYIDKLVDIVNKYNNTYRTIKMKPLNVKPTAYIDSSKEINDKDPRFKIGDIARMSKYKNIFAKGYVPNWSEEVFMIKKLKTRCSGHVISDLSEEEIVERFYKKNCKQQIKKSLEKIKDAIIFLDTGTGTGQIKKDII